MCASLSFGELLIPCCWAITHSDMGSCCSPFRYFTNAFLREAGYMFSEPLQMFPWWPHSCKLQQFTISVGDCSSLYLSNRKHHKPHRWVNCCVHFCVRKQHSGSNTEPWGSRETFRRKQQLKSSNFRFSSIWCPFHPDFLHQRLWGSGSTQLNWSVLFHSSDLHDWMKGFF